MDDSDARGRIYTPRAQFREPWEAEASLRLRAGQREPLDRYAAHGRIHTGDPDKVQQRMLDDWEQAHRDRVSYAFSVPTVEQANQLSQRAQQRRIEAGELDRDRHIATERGQRLYVGDMVATRANEGRREMVKGGRVRNRERWTVTAINRDGSVTLTRQGTSRTVEVSREYASRHVELGYFSTVHAVQGRTVERGGTLVDENAGFRSVYVGMTRGVEVNRAYVIAPDKVDGRDVVERAMLRDRADLGVLAQQRTLEEVARRREAELRRKLGRPLNALERARARELGDLGHGREL